MKYLKELGILREKLPEPAQNQLRVYGVLLYANLQAEKQLGMTRAVKSERKKILAQLDAITRQHLRIKLDALGEKFTRAARPSVQLRLYRYRRAATRPGEKHRILAQLEKKDISGTALASTIQTEKWLRDSSARLGRQGMADAPELRRDYKVTLDFVTHATPGARPPGQHAKPPEPVPPPPPPPPPTTPPAFDLPVIPSFTDPTSPPPKAAPPGAPRYTNVNFVDAVERTRVVGADHSLAAAKAYLLRVNIGEKLAESIVTNASKIPFPAENLPHSEDGWWLDVRVDSREFGIAGATARMFLPKASPSWVCDCAADQPHTCQPAARQPFLYLPVTTPDASGSARLDLMIYYHNNLVQSLLVTAAISEVEQQGAGHRATIQFSLDARLDDLNLPARDLNILTTRTKGGERRVIVNGAEADIALDLNEDQVRVTLEDARQALRDAHYEERTNDRGVVFDRRNKYDVNTLAKKREEFVEDLARLANMGQALWGLLLQSYPPETWKMLEAPRSIQVSRVSNSTFLFPWAMIYDIPLEPGVEPALCPVLEKANWETFAKTFESEQPRACPHAADHYSPTGGNVLCPFGFWGFKHFIESPPSVPKGGSLKTTILRGNSPPQIVVARSTRLDSNLTSKHLQSLRDLKLAVTDCDNSAAVRDALKGQMELVYFYCHGKWTKDARRKPYLEVGQDEAILPDHILFWRRQDWGAQHWASTAPLVIINGCHTLEITPESLLNFVDGFTNAQAAGVIGTEISIEQNIASEAARLFLTGFRAGSSVGEALHAMRLALLARNNLMGLNYTAYCSTDLALEDSPV